MARTKRTARPVPKTNTAPATTAAPLAGPAKVAVPPAPAVMNKTKGRKGAPTKMTAKKAASMGPSRLHVKGKDARGRERAGEEKAPRRFHPGTGTTAVMDTDTVQLP